MTTELTSSDRLRLRTLGTAVGSGFVDGGWWPRSLDLGTELPGLLASLASVGDSIRQVTYSLAAWDPTPLKVTVAGRRIKLGGFRSLDEASIGLVDSSGWKRLVLVVVPPDTEPATAERALALAGLDGDHHRATEILDVARLDVRRTA